MEEEGGGGGVEAGREHGAWRRTGRRGSTNKGKRMKVVKSTIFA